MVYDTQNILTPTQRAKLLAKSNLKDAFKEEAFGTFNVFNKDIIPYLTDYFMLINDLKSIVNEEERKCYSDYSFVISPLNKAFESYLSGLLSYIFEIEVSYKINETIGHHLGIPLDQRKDLLTKLEKLYAKTGMKLTQSKWLDIWEALRREWSANRNPLTHSGEEKLLTLRQAEQAASSIIREIDLSCQLIEKEFFGPILTFMKKSEEAKKTETK